MINEQDYVGFALDAATGKRKPIRHFAKVAEWEPGIFMHETYEQVIGGEQGLDNLPLQQLANRTEYLKAHLTSNETLQMLCDEINKLRRYVYAYTPDGVKKIQVQMSRDAPTDSNIAWIKTDGSDTIIDPELNITVDGAEVPFIGNHITVDGKVYELSNAEDMGLVDITLPAFADILPAEEITPVEKIEADEPVTVESGCHCEHATITNEQINQSIDNFIDNLEV